MRLSYIAHWALAVSTSLIASPVSATTTDNDDDFQLRQLTDDNFKSNTAQGLWLIEHFSPKCGHCRAFAPTWTQLAKDKQHLERLTGFHMAQVNCLAQGDLCNSNGIKFYPQLILYIDGVPQPHYSGDRSHADLSAYIDEHSSTYSQEAMKDAEENAEGAGSRFANPVGKIAEVDELGLEALRSSGPVLTEFFAPWCGHCKRLRPIYEQLADAMKGKLNIAAVDCEDHKAFCRSVGIQGYPTIRMFHHATSTEYTGPRSLEKLSEFASKAIKVTALHSIRANDFEDVVKQNEALFLYLQNFDTTVAEQRSVKAALEPLIGSVPAYTSSDPQLYKRLSISNPPPTSVLLAFSSYSTRPVGSLPFPASQQDVNRFVQLHRFPTLVELTGANHAEFMKGDAKAIVVLGALHKGQDGTKEREQLGEIARAWKRGGRRFDQPVWFVWVDGEKWSGWLKQSYGIRKKELPAVVVIDPPNNEYYDTTIEGNKISFDGASTFSVLEGFYQHFLKPKRIETTLEWGSRSAAMTLISLGQTSVEHPFAALIILIGAVAIFVFLLQRCVGRDLKEAGITSRLD
ncbi:protein disulfide-isomerase domain [Kwoniella newhampshirensis]|uniref:Protein disulfide-isomerase domain n=1 Tax=Kwoniella newhampshirensis TaxID=1651941 RepID=A0AAW0Z0V4_9TREE